MVSEFSPPDQETAPETKEQAANRESDEEYNFEILTMSRPFACNQEKFPRFPHQILSNPVKLSYQKTKRNHSPVNSLPLRFFFRKQSNIDAK